MRRMCSILNKRIQFINLNIFLLISNLQLSIYWLLFFYTDFKIDIHFTFRTKIDVLEIVIKILFFIKITDLSRNITEMTVELTFRNKFLIL